jgi:hypothetical protein
VERDGFSPIPKNLQFRVGLLLLGLYRRARGR